MYHGLCVAPTSLFRGGGLHIDFHVVSVSPSIYCDLYLDSSKHYSMYSILSSASKKKNTNEDD